MIYDYCVYAYLNIVSSVKQGDLGNFLKSRSVFFKCQKYVKKGSWKWENNFTLSL